MASPEDSYEDEAKKFSSCSELKAGICNGFNHEEKRLKSFASWPVYFPVDPGRLAKAGFYYTGIADEVVCFSCQGHVKNWNYGDIVLTKHADLYPNCDFINNRSNNVPLLKTSVKSKSQSSLIENQSMNIDSLKSIVSIDFEKMKSENERLKTFNEKWPLSFINVSDLAHAGFFYTGTDCKVQCPYCKGVISNWKTDSIPIQEHLKLFPWCDYFSLNILEVKKQQPWFSSSSQDICGTMTKQIDSNSNSAVQTNMLVNDNKKYLEDLGVHLHKGPIHPQHASLIARLKSFETWPSDSPVLSNDLATAGFFYIGIGDRTICFHCNGGLCSWEEGDDPWIEHARWFPTCDFLRLNKGSDFIDSCDLKKFSKLKQNNPQKSMSFDFKESILKKVDEFMKQSEVKCLLESGIHPPYLVRAALLTQMRHHGHFFRNLDDLFVATSYLKEKMEEGEKSFDSTPEQPQLSVNADNLNPTEMCFEGSSDDSLVNSNASENFPSSQVSHSEVTNLKASDSVKRNFIEENDQCICKICMDKEVEVLFLPCRHLSACAICAAALNQCPICRKSIQATVRVYLN